METTRHPDKSVQGIAKRLKALREAYSADMNQKEFAIWAEIMPQAWNNYERGRRRIDIDQATKLCVKTGVTLDWIYSGAVSGLPFRIASKLPPEQSEAG